MTEEFFVIIEETVDHELVKNNEVKILKTKYLS